jgi:iron complex transport system substrate-binding protein
MGETLARLGAKNIIPKGMGPFPKINPEFVVRANPDVIMLGQQDAAGLKQRPGWAAISAIQRQQVCTFTAAQDDVLVRAGPRMAQGAWLMAKCLSEVLTKTQKPTQEPTQEPKKNQTQNQTPKTALQ